jgi:DNA replication protein DnaC
VSAYTTRACIDCGELQADVRCKACHEYINKDSAARRRMQGDEAMLAVGVPANLASVRLEAPWDNLAWGFDKHGDFLHGLPGRGKSFIAAGLVRIHLKFVSQRVRPGVEQWWLGHGGTRWVRVEAMLQQIRDLSFTQEASEAEVVGGLGRVGFLVLDDLGAEKRTEWGGQTLHSLLDQRLAANARTIITSNYTVEDLEEMYAGWGGPIASRIRGLCDIREVRGADRRATR